MEIEVYKSVRASWKHGALRCESVPCINKPLFIAPHDDSGFPSGQFQVLTISASRVILERVTGTMTFKRGDFCATVDIVIA